MTILTIRTDKPEAEVGIYDGDRQVRYKTWLAHRQLAETLHQVIADELMNHGLTLKDMNGIVVYQGPGSFTGLRIGLSVANSLAYAQQVPIVGGIDDDWLEQGLARIIAGQTDEVVLPEYGADVHITTPKK